MKNLFLALAVTFSLTSCISAQEAAQPIVVHVPATVQFISNGQASLLSRDFGRTYFVDATGLEINKEYEFILELEDCAACKPKNAIVRNYNVSIRQTQRDLAAMQAKFNKENPKIEK